VRNPFVVGEHLYLRPLEPVGDAELYASWLNAEEVRRHFSIYPKSKARAVERLEQLYKGGEHVLLGIALIADDQLVGLTGLKDINHVNQTAEFYVLIGEPVLWGRGYGTEATTLMLRYGFMELNLNRIQALDMEENLAGWRADEKAGFVHEGTLRQAILRHGKYHDVRLYSVLRRDYLKSLQPQP
jgi:RimJ/RimL family protein N-acetyltransferase